MSQDATPPRPVLRIVRGTPDEAEIAAVTAALLGLATARTARPEPARPLSTWADRASGLRRPGTPTPLHPGPHAWRASALPR